MLELYNKLSGKTRFYLILIGIFFLYFLAYSLTIKKTINSYNEYKSIKKQLEGIGNAHERLATVKSRLIELDSLIGNFRQSNFQLQLLENIGMYCQKNNIAFNSFPKVHQIEEQNFLVNTYTIECEAGFSKLLNLVYFLEQKKKFGKVVSVNYYVKKDAIYKNSKLYVNIYIQSLSNINDEF